MMKKTIIAPLASLLLVGCADNEFLGSEEAQHIVNGEKPILFESGAKALTRTDIVGTPAAKLLNENYIVLGVKGNGTNRQLVFDHYNINWYEGTAGSTETNVADWEYVGQDPNPLSSLYSGTTPMKQQIKYWDYSTSQYDFVAFSYGHASKDNVTLSSIQKDNIGTSTAVYTVKGSASQIAKTYIADLVTVPKAKYNTTVTPRFRQMGTKVRMAIYETVPGYSVRIDRFYTSNTRLAKYATEKAVLYATDADGKRQAVLPSMSGTGTMSVYIPDATSGKASIAYSADAGVKGTSVLSFEALPDFNVYAAPEGRENASYKYIGRSSTEATYASKLEAETTNKEYKMVLPYGGSTVLRLHLDYTLVSIDGSGEEIHVKGATALVPTQYTNWQPNYAYTYIFKITKDTNGTTGNPGTPGTDPDDPNDPDHPGTDPENPKPIDPDDPDNPDPTYPPTDPDPDPTPDGPDPSGLYPIVFDACVMDYGDGIQETITTISDPSITTYSKGQQPTAAPEYKTGNNIYVSVDEADGDLTDANTKLYTATVETGALQGIDESSIANALTKYSGVTATSATAVAAADIEVGTTDVSSYYTLSGDVYYKCSGVAKAETTYYTIADTDITGYVVKDAAGKKLTVSAADGLTIETEIAAEDAVDGKAVSGNFAKFKPSAAGTYVFEYTVTTTTATGSETKKFYKIIIVHD